VWNSSWDFSEKLAWDTHALEHAKENFWYPTHGESVFHTNPSHQDYFINSHDLFKSYVSHALCDYCESSDHDVHTCPYRDYADATCGSIEKTINEMTNLMVEIMKQRIAQYFNCFNHSREDINLHKNDSSLGSPKPEVSLYDDFEPSSQSMSNLQDVQPFPSLEQ